MTRWAFLTTMKRTRLMALTCGLMMALPAGCESVMALHPLVTKETVTFREDLLGSWSEDSEKPEYTWEVTRLEPGAVKNLPSELRDVASQCYRIMMVSEQEGCQGSFVGCLVKLQGKLFLDLVPDAFPFGVEDSECTQLTYNAFLFLRVHTFARVFAQGDELTIGLTQEEDFQELLEAEPGAVPCDTADEHTILTASTPALQMFVMKYADDERLFSNEMTLRRKTDSAAE